MVSDDRADGKRQELIQIAEAAVLSHKPRRGAEKIPERSANKLAAAVVDAFASLTPPKHEISIGLMTMFQGGTGGGSSVKPGNILLNWRTIIIEGSLSVLAAVEGVKKPWLAPFAALAIWCQLWRMNFSPELVQSVGRNSPSRIKCSTKAAFAKPVGEWAATARYLVD